MANIDNKLTGLNTNIQLTVGWAAEANNLVGNQYNTTQNNSTLDASQLAMGFGSGNGENQLAVSEIFSCPAGTTTIISLNNIYDVCGQGQGGLSDLRALFIQLLSRDQSDQGTDCYSVEFGNGPAIPESPTFDGPDNPTEYPGHGPFGCQLAGTLFNGGYNIWSGGNGNFVTRGLVTPGLLWITNSDATGLDAAVAVTAFGLSSKGFFDLADEEFDALVDGDYYILRD